jgi:hypothetical protein
MRWEVESALHISSPWLSSTFKSIGSSLFFYGPRRSLFEWIELAGASTKHSSHQEG